MADDGLRRLEREAAQGDPQAAARLARERARVGAARAWMLLDTWPLDDKERAHDALFTLDGDLLVVGARRVRLMAPSPLAPVRGLRRPPAREVACAALWEGARPRAAPAGGIRVRPRARLVLGERRTSCGGACSLVTVGLPGLDRPRALHETDEVGFDAVAAGGDVVVAAMGDVVRAWREGGGVTTWRHPERVRALAMDALGRRVLILGERTAIVRDPSQVDDVAALALDAPPLPTCAVTADGALAVTASRDAVHVWEAGTGQRVRCVPCDGAHRVTLARSGLLLTVHGDRVGLWDVGSGQQLGVTPRVEERFRAATLDPTERLLVAVGQTRVWTFRQA